MADADFTFDKDNHLFIVDGRVWPSITQILSAEGFINGQWFTEYSRNRGSYIHQIVHWHIIDELDTDSIDPTLKPYYDAWLAFERDVGFVSIEVEQPRINHVYQFGGIPDHVALLNGKESIIDVKSGVDIPATALQTAAQEILIGKLLPRYSLQLKADGKYSLKHHTDRQDRKIFLSALACYNWRKNHGLVKE